MPSLRTVAVGLTGTGIACATILAVPASRHMLERAVLGHWHRHAPTREIAHDRTTPPAVPKIDDRVAEAPPVAGERLEAQATEAAPAKPVEPDPPPGPSLAARDPDAASIRDAIEAYRRGDVAGGDARARPIAAQIPRLAAEWAALRLQPRDAGLARLDAFATGHADWPAKGWLQRRIEEAIAGMPDNAALVESRLSNGTLQTVSGKIARARLAKAAGRLSDAADIARDTWREDDLFPIQEATLLREFGDAITREDHKYRADRLLYKEQNVAGLREAALAGPDFVLLARARVAVNGNQASDALMAAVPKALQTDPGYLFARLQRARRAGRLPEAVAILDSAPREIAKLVDGDSWWVERRILARKLLDKGDASTAYRLCAEHAAETPSQKIEAEFHAGWIALRFLGDPSRALGHFTRASLEAESPISRARVAYWQGRALEAAAGSAAAQSYYDEAARYPISFYGQLAAEKLGRTDLILRSPAQPATGDARSEAVRAVEFLYGIGERDVALPLALEIARNEPSEAQVAALGDVLTRAKDAWATLAVGKAATQRGLNLDEVAFPTFGIPQFQPLPKSADLSVVYAIARQESEFDQRSVSSAGAKGLMQMISSTARRTAARAGVGYDDTRLQTDAAFNAQLGAAHLGALMDELGGSYILTAAAYNAGGKAVKDWIDAYGDPRKPGVDPVDWIERIPYSETRNYVQRVIENLQVYRARLGQPSFALIGTDAVPGKRS